MAHCFLKSRLHHRKRERFMMMTLKMRIISSLLFRQTIRRTCKSDGKNAVEIEEIDLTVDDDDCLVYFATSPSHHSIDENIVKTEEISSSSDSDCEMDTTIHASPQFLTSGYSEAAFRISITSELATGIPESVSGIVSLGEINYYFYFKYLC
jgi:hypothetical protein